MNIKIVLRMMTIFFAILLASLIMAIIGYAIDKVGLGFECTVIVIILLGLVTSYALAKDW